MGGRGGQSVGSSAGVEQEGWGIPARDINREGLPPALCRWPAELRPPTFDPLGGLPARGACSLGWRSSTYDSATLRSVAATPLGHVRSAASGGYPIEWAPHSLPAGACEGVEVRRSFLETSPEYEDGCGIQQRNLGI